MHQEAWIDQNGDGRSDLAVVLVHGRGGRPDDMQRLAADLGLGQTRGIFPAATGFSWYPQRFLEPIAANEPALSAAIAHCEAIVAGLIAAGVPAERILVGGFSQGACLTAEFLARHPRRYAGALVFTGGLIGPPGTTWPVRQALVGVPVYLTTSRVDEWVPVDRVNETAAWLRSCGADVTLRLFEDRPHVVSADEIADARDMIRRIAA